MAKLPWMKFFPADYLVDTTPLSPVARGIWMDIICLLWRSNSSGTLALSDAQWLRYLRCSKEEMVSASMELTSYNICVIEVLSADLTSITSRRMARDEKTRDSSRLRQARMREKGGGDPLRWASIRVQILERDKYVCGYCGIKARTVDHINPKCRGGDEHEDNLVACCKKCNFKKNKRTLEECGLTLKFSNHHSSVTRPSLVHHKEKLEARSQKLEEEKDKTPLNPSTPAGVSTRSVEDWFEEWWKAMPAKNGKRLYKEKAREFYERFVQPDQRDMALAAAKAYAKHCLIEDRKACDPFRFLYGQRGQLWRDFIPQSSPTPPVHTKVNTTEVHESSKEPVFCEPPPEALAAIQRLGLHVPRSNTNPVKPSGFTKLISEREPDPMLND